MSTDHTLSADQTRRLAWWQEARFGMFIHWGLYSATDQDCWQMADMGTPVEEYIRRFEPKFTGENFDARELVALAKRAGCRYVVMGARHHEGYCLWNTDTTSFSSSRMTPKRDFIDEFVEAAREAGLGVGIYYSLLDWRWQAYWAGPQRDPAGWARLVTFVHAQVEELMSRYGRIDVLWYDGAWAAPFPLYSQWGYEPDRAQLAEAWDSVALNAMVRRHQPNILINNRSFLPEDFGTPEKDLHPEARPWELCDTMGFNWGASQYDLDRKSARHLVWRLAFCASHGGNMLLNVGPKADGTVMLWQREILEQVGDWLDRHGQCIYASRGVTEFPFGEGLAPWNTTSVGNKLYLILSRYPGSSFGVANQHNYKLLSARMMTTGQPLELTHERTRDVISGLPVEPPDPLACVVEVETRTKTETERAERSWIGLPEADVASDMTRSPPIDP